jgi:hypothetical protein
MLAMATWKMIKLRNREVGTMYHDVGLIAIESVLVCAE